MYEVQQRGKNKFFACVMYGYALSDALWIPKRQEEHQLCEWVSVGFNVTSDHT